MICQLSNTWWIFVLLGICTGIVSGALGLGGGIVLIPTLVLFFGFGQKNAQGMALAVMVPMVLVGAWRYWKNPQIEINLTIVGCIILGSLAGVLVGTELASRLPSHILRKVFAAVLVIAAIRMFMTSSKIKRANLHNNLTQQKTVSPLEYGENNEPDI